MLKDITLGQFFPGNTPIHRLDPRTKLLCVILYIVALFNAKGPLTYGIMIVVLFFRKGIMGTRELSLAGLADRLRKKSAKGGKQA